MHHLFLTYIIYYLMPIIFYGGMIYCLSSLSPTPDKLPTMVGIDKVLHWMEYAVFGYLLVRATAVLQRSSWLSRHGAMAAVSVGILYAVSDEWHQSFVRGRDASSLDLLFDVLGLVCGVIFRRNIREGVRLLSSMEARSEEALRRGT